MKHKNIKISEEAYKKIKIMAGDKSLKDTVDDLVGLNKVETPVNLDELILNIMGFMHKTSKIIRRKYLVEHVVQWAEMNSYVGWASLHTTPRSKFHNDVDNALKKNLRYGTIEKVDTGKYVAKKWLQ